MNWSALAGMTLKSKTIIFYSLRLLTLTVNDKRIQKLNTNIEHHSSYAVVFLCVKKVA